jgi:hypothetical protein
MVMYIQSRISFIPSLMYSRQRRWILSLYVHIPLAIDNDDSLHVPKVQTIVWFTFTQHHGDNHYIHHTNKDNIIILLVYDIARVHLSKNKRDYSHTKVQDITQHHGDNNYIHHTNKDNIIILLVYNITRVHLPKNKRDYSHMKVQDIIIITIWKADGWLDEYKCKSTTSFQTTTIWMEGSMTSV